MTSTIKHSRARMTWLASPAVRRFSAQLRPKWTALQVFRGSVKGYVKAEPAAAPSGSAGHPQRRAQPGPGEIIEPIPRNAASHEIADPMAIRESLQALAASGQAVTIWPAGATEPVLACILSVHDSEPRFTLLLNDGARLPGGACTFVTRLEAARFQFELGGWSALPGLPTHLVADFPAHGLVLNRRAAARLETPLAGSYTASFVLFGSPYELQLYDVAAGGIGMRCAPRDAPGLHVGRRLPRVRLELNDTVVICDLEVRLSRRFRSFLLGEQVQIGCRFVDLSPAMQAAVDKAIGKMTTGRR